MPDYGHKLEFGYFLTPEAADPAGVLATARLLDALGYDFIGIQDHPYQPRFLDALALLAYVLAQTERVRVFPAVANLALRPSALLAKEAASLDRLSGGRFELALGTGGFQQAAAAMGGAVRSPGEQIAALAEAIEVIRAMWSGERGVRYAGSYYQLAGLHAGPTPAHDIGIWIGSRGPRALALTGRSADGWVSPMMGYLPPGEAAQASLSIDAAAREVGRSPAAVRRIYIIPGAFAPVASHPPSDADQSIVGPVDHWVTMLEHLAADFGFSSFGFAAPPDPDALRTFIEEVAPRVRERVAARRARAPETP